MDLRERLLKMMRVDVTAVPPQTAREPLGSIIEREEGAFVRRDLRYPLGHQHGELAFADLLDVDPGRIALIGADPELGQFDPRRAVFLDVETTALYGGAGTYVFLTGLAWIDGDELRLSQYFMRDFDEELALLNALNDQLREFDFIVTFFGKNFDRHRLGDRFTFYGLDNALPARHFDLCHAGRRLFAGWFVNLRLKTLERELLGLERLGDLPGAECAQVYFDFLSGLDDGRLRLVFQHNLVDVLSLVTLATRMDRCLGAPQSAIDFVAAARALERAHNFAEAARAFQSARDAELPRALRAVTLERLAFLHRKLGQSTEACQALVELCELMPDSYRPSLELAKELHRRAPGSALQHLDVAREKLVTMLSQTGQHRLTRELHALDRRRERLACKISKGGRVD